MASRAYRKTGNIQKRWISLLLSTAMAVGLVIPAGAEEVSSADSSSSQTAVQEEASDALLQTAEEVSDKIDSSEEVSAAEVADMIGTIVEAAGGLAGADETSLAEMQDTISEVQEQYDSLSADEQAALSESAGFLQDASAAVSTLQETQSGATDTASGAAEDESGGANSWRYINGTPISYALETISEEQDSVTDLTESTTEEASAKAAETAETEESDEQQTAAGTEAVTAAASLPDVAEHKGIDVSYWQGSIDWTAVKDSGVEFAILRCGYRASSGDREAGTDSTFQRNVSGCVENGIKYGVYFYSTAQTEEELDEEVEIVLEQLEGLSPDLPVYIDMEDSGQYSAIGGDNCALLANRFVEEIQAAGYKAGIYANYDWYTNKINNTMAIPNCYHWVAQYSSSCDVSENHEMWQYSSSGTVDGISTSVDMNIWYGTLGSINTVGRDVSVEIEDGIYNIEFAGDTDKVVSVADGSTANGAKIVLWDNEGGSSQQWLFTKLDNGWYSIVNVNSGKSLDVTDLSTENGTQLQQYTVNGCDAQQFLPLQNEDGSIRLICRCSFKVVNDRGGSTTNGNVINQYSYDQTDTQKFQLEKLDTDITESTYYICYGSDSDMVLTVENGSTDPGASVVLSENVGSPAQQWTVTEGSDGWYTITNVNSGLCLDVQDASTEEHARIQQYTSNGSYAQQFSACENSNGTISLIARCSMKALNNRYGLIVNGNQIDQYTYDGTDTEQFTLQEIDRFSDVTDSSTYYYQAVYWAKAMGIAGGYTSGEFLPDGACSRAQIVSFLYRMAGSPDVSGDCPFSDVDTGDYYYNAVLWAVEENITSGIASDLFGPDTTCTRAQAVTFLWRYYGTDEVSTDLPFTDVDEDSYYYMAVCWAYQNGITQGTSDTNFSPDASCTRGQIVTLLYNAKNAM